ncbi:hypothetical protein N9B39_02800 [bacterium]|nr:hypothetical protein [bacterium]
MQCNHEDEAIAEELQAKWLQVSPSAEVVALDLGNGSTEFNVPGVKVLRLANEMDSDSHSKKHMGRRALFPFVR